MVLWLIRAVFVLVVGGLAARMAKAAGEAVKASGGNISPSLLFLVVMSLAILVLVADLLTPRKRIQSISALYFGLIVGLILSNLVQTAIEPSLGLFFAQNMATGIPQAILGLLTVAICYVCVSTLLQTKDDFRFIIP